MKKQKSVKMWGVFTTEGTIMAFPKKYMAEVEEERILEIDPCIVRPVTVSWEEAKKG